MYIAVVHIIDIQEAKEKMKELLSSIIEKNNSSSDSKVTLKVLSEVWDGDKMDFSLKAKKNFLPGVTINGKVWVNKDNVEIKIELPGLVSSKDEETLKSFIKEETKNLLN